MAAMKLSKVRMLKDRVVKKKVWTDFSSLADASKDAAQTPTGNPADGFPRAEELLLATGPVVLG